MWVSKNICCSHFVIFCPTDSTINQLWFIVISTTEELNKNFPAYPLKISL